ncbi:MAG: bifunctional riboflavin kinase/FAD synthetase [Deltaproteobacteria bacterium]|jgi:riboflavin kinase/FMN adenylyltransferase|nr:bifunctional riboflavin kinase/FAD synthetase [Deltaproteobacteria bacterium]
MEIIRKEKNFQSEFKNPVLTIGNFDGVHLGHQRIFQRVKEKAREIGGDSIVYTFEPHPVELLAPERKPLLVTPSREKLRLIEEQGIDIAICANFSPKFASQTPEEFVKNILYDQIKIRQLFVGHDYTFGKDRRGNIAMLRDLGKKLGFNVEVVEAVRVAGAVVSSTRIRELIQKGEMPEAAKMLGRNYPLSGKVIHGHGRGSKQLGFPTANLKPEGALFPKPGIYATWTYHEGKKYAGVANLGWNPTFHDQKFSIEVHILNFDRDIYGQTLRVEFVERLRDEITFRGPEELVAQIKKDISQAKSILKGS